MYYWLLEFLERRLYSNPRTSVAAVSEKTADAVAKYCGRKAPVTVVYNGIDLARFNPGRRTELRSSSRAAIGLADDAFAILLVGNDWKKKGLAYLLEAVGQMRTGRTVVLVAGQDTMTPYTEMIQRLCLTDRIMFLPLRQDVEFYYAAADAYAGPSLDDSFALPPAECMACGLPVITTRLNGGHAIMHHGVDGLILDDPSDIHTLAEWLSRLSEDVTWRTQMGENAATTAAQYTWARNARLMQQLFESARNAEASRKA
jgi:UDP-glucose:(heptosyl)LPS alpha-1,3-glucosyltransferase